MNVLISGASTGIGKATALHLASLGYQVFAGVRRISDGEALEAQAPSNLRPVLLDVTQPDSIEATAQILAQEALQGLHGLVNNAGIAIAGPLEHLPMADLRRQLEVNVLGQVALTQAVLPLLRQAKHPLRGAGRVVNISSISGKVASPMVGPYAMSKFALEAFTDALRRELMRWNIEVVAIEPGNIQTPIWEKTLDWASHMRAKLSSVALEQYGPEIDTASRYAAQAVGKGLPATEVAKVIEAALSRKTPRTRYVVGRDAQMGAFLARLLPDRWIDRWVFSRRR